MSAGDVYAAGQLATIVICLIVFAALMLWLLRQDPSPRSRPYDWKVDGDGYKRSWRSRLQDVLQRLAH